MRAEEWITRYAEGLGVDPPDPETVTALLDLAGVAAHSSERLAAPLTTWLVGVAGLDPTEALDRARRLAETENGPADNTTKPVD